MLKTNERIDDLECRGYKIIQSSDGYCFTSDSVLLANLVDVNKGDRVVDLCTGSGVIALLIAAKYSPCEVIGVEIQERLANMASRSVELNNASDVVKIVNAPVQNVAKIIGNGFDVVTVNPPYDVAPHKENYTEHEICKCEVMLTVEETVASAAKLLKYGGLFFMINKARRLADVICAMRNNNIEPKKIIFIQPKLSKSVDTFIVEGKLGGKPSMNIPAPLIVYEENGEYTEKARRLYNK